ncbi:conserved protein of unknown function [Pseudomonas marincola]|uniref:Uncharacterized protein n=1 Tax=Pseudomonas marincola TaxID=437900 RepID=A0A653E4V3_9PSED|nr:conserved protein of unknown function [Pseudomonas marincola]
MNNNLRSSLCELLRLCETLRAAPERYSYQELIDCCMSAQSLIEDLDYGPDPAIDHAAGIVLFRLVVNAWAKGMDYRSGIAPFYAVPGLNAPARIHHIELTAVAEVTENELIPLQPATTPTNVRLLCLLVRSRNGKPRALPVHVVQRLPAPWSTLSQQWPLVLPTGFHLRSSHPINPSAEVLVHSAGRRKANAICSPMGCNL